MLYETNVKIIIWFILKYNNFRHWKLWTTFIYKVYHEFMTVKIEIWLGNFYIFSFADCSIVTNYFNENLQYVVIMGQGKIMNNFSNYLLKIQSVEKV